MDKERRIKARQDAINCIELTKGFTYDTSTSWGRSITSINALSSHILEMTQDIAEEAFQRTLNGI